MTALPPLPSRQARVFSLVCPTCAAPVVLTDGAIECTGEFMSDFPRGSHRFTATPDLGPLAQLVTGDRHVRDCWEIAKPLWHRRTRSCIRWEVRTGRRVAKRGQAS